MKFIYSSKFLPIAVLFFSSLAHAYQNAGVLPYYYDKNGKAFFLIGQEPNGVWADFGGRGERSEDPLDTAAREFSEETRYVFGKYADRLENLELRVNQTYLNKSSDYIKHHVTAELLHQKKYYTMFLAEVDFICAEIFNNAYKVPHYEKRSYAWVSVDELMDVVKNSIDRNKTFYQGKQLRAPFFDTLKTHQNNILKTVYPNKKSVHKEKNCHAAAS